MITPNIQLISAATREHRMLVRKACRMFGLVTSRKNSDGDNFSAYTSTDANGISTMSESIVTVIPKVR